MVRSLATPSETARLDARVPKPGEVIEGKYRIEKVLGEGGMGVVLAAHHELLDQPVAVKVLTSSDPRAMSRFSLEAKATAQLKSQHVARVMDVGVLPDGAPFMVMEYLEGCNLEELLRLHKRLPVEEAVGYVLDALDGLAQAHALEIVHRDLKPANLFLAAEANGDSIVKIVDFGISKSVASRSSGRSGGLTADHATVGSPTYMAPEQIRSPKDVDARTDIWAIGVVLYELLCGTAPFRGDSVGEIFAAVLENRPPPLQSAAPDVPAPLSDVVARCLSPREQRYPDVLALAVDLAPFGPEDAMARVSDIEQTVRAMKAKAEGRDIGRITGRTATRTPAAGTPAAESGHVAFTSDAPVADERHKATSPSLRRQGSRRKLLTIAGGAGFAAAVTIAAIVRQGPAPRVATTPTTQPPPAAVPLPPAPPATASTPAAAGATDVPAVAFDSLPTARHHVAPPPSSPAPRKVPAAVPVRKHYAVLDSPD
jgi:eukaryotic-like serine/threonine-protein kinase